MRLVALACAAACGVVHSPLVFAQTSATPALKEVVVTASRTPTRVDDLVSEVVIIERADIEKSTGRTLAEILTRNAGVQFSSNGGAGKSSSINIRGTEARHTILLIDGVRYGSATLGTPVWDNIPLETIERIEVLKGPASSLYGSDAVGGVVQIFTRQGSKALSPRAKVTVGSNSYRQLSAGLSGSASALGYSLDVLSSRDKGFSATNAKVPFGNFNEDRDGFKQDAVNANISYQFSPDWKASAGLLYSDGLNQYDDGPGMDTRATVRTQTLRAGVEGKFTPGWKTALRFGQSKDTANAIESAFLPSDFKTRQDQITWQNDIDTPIGVALLGIENLKQAVSGSTAYDVSTRTVASYFAGINGNAGAHSWQINLRHDSNSQFGSNDTGFVGYGFKITPAWRVNASYGTSFVAPSFNQLYYPGFGNPLLQPETGKNTDVGVTYSEGGHTVKLVHFDNKIRGFITSTTKPTNVPRAKIEGWTLGYDGKLGNLNLRASVDSLNPRNELTDKVLPRRNTNQLSLGADYVVGVWGFGGSLFKAGSRYDNTANTVQLDGYTTVDIFADYQLNKDWKLQAKVNNLANKDYQTILGYNQPGRQVYLTLNFQPK